MTLLILDPFRLLTIAKRLRQSVPEHFQEWKPISDEKHKVHGNSEEQAFLKSYKNCYIAYPALVSTVNSWKTTVVQTFFLKSFEKKKPECFFQTLFRKKKLQNKTKDGQMAILIVTVSLGTRESYLGLICCNDFHDNSQGYILTTVLTLIQL